jgi:hypothetical protein
MTPSPASASSAHRWLPTATAVLSVVTCAAILAVTKAISTLIPEAGASPTLYLAGGITILAIPAAIAWYKRALRPTGAELLVPFAFYLSMYQAPLARLVVGGSPLDSAEINVLDMALYASQAVSCLVSLRPGAFDPRHSLPPPLDDASPHSARLEAYAGVAAMAFGYALLAIWIGSVGLERMSSASVTDVYLYGANRATVSFQWPFIVGGILTIAHAFARWPGGGPPLTLRVLYLISITAYISVTLRLGARGPTIEILGAIYLIRSETRRPVSRRLLVAGTVLIAVLFFLGSAMRSRLYSGFQGASVSDAADRAEGAATGEGPSEFDAIFENHVMVVRLAGVKMPYLEGGSWADLPLQLIPRQILDSKPQGLSAWWIRYVDAETARRGGGRAFGSFAEGYLNFGVPGAVAQVAVVTLALLALLPWLRALPVGIAPAAATVLSLGYHCHRSELVFLEFTARNAAIVALATALAHRLVTALLKPVRAPA